MGRDISGDLNIQSFAVKLLVNDHQKKPPSFAVKPTSNVTLASGKGEKEIQIVLRPFTVPPPAHALEELRRMRITCGWDVELIEEWLADIEEGRRLQWTAFHNSEPIGMCALNIYSIHDQTLANGWDRAEVAGMFLYDNWRSQGIGKTMMTFVEETAAGFGVKTTTVNTRALGPSLEPYKRRGYKEYKDRESKYTLDTILGLGLTPEHMAAAFLQKPAPKKAKRSWHL